LARILAKIPPLWKLGEDKLALPRAHLQAKNAVKTKPALRSTASYFQRQGLDDAMGLRPCTKNGDAQMYPDDHTPRGDRLNRTCRGTVDDNVRVDMKTVGRTRKHDAKGNLGDDWRMRVGRVRAGVAVKTGRLDAEEETRWGSERLHMCESRSTPLV
jgi:hypothetical protein